MPPISAQLLTHVTIVVPIGPGDTSWRGLLPSFSHLAADAELVLVATEPQPSDFEALTAKSGIRCHVQSVQSAEGRARQMNHGARLAGRKYLWFLHADSRLNSEQLRALDLSLAVDREALFYFDLAYEPDGLSLTGFNAWGVYFRSHCLGLPFGDQGLCLGRELFHRLGGFDESAPYGEDHLLVWAARRRRVPIRCVGATLTTSARKFADEGWLRTTWLHFWRTWRQALPQWLKLLWSRLG